MFSAIPIGRSSTYPAASTAGVSPAAGARSGNDASADDARRRARHMRIRDDTRRILVDFREAERDRRRPEYRRRRPVRMALKDP
jgi:hypothetical protein